MTYSSPPVCVRFVAVAVVASMGAVAAPAFEMDEERLLDLSHPFDERTIYWPTARGFTRERVTHGETAGGYWYAAGEFCAAEHGGTHLDAPIHFSATGQSAAEVPLRRLMGPALVVDISERAAGDPDTMLTVADLDAFEARHGRVSPGAIVLVRTGWAARWPDRRRYLGDDAPGDASRLHFPGVGRDAAARLVERRVDAVGIDTASIDPGRSSTFDAHRVLAAANVPVLENLAHLDEVPETGAHVVALPMKIGGGSGGPLRAIVVLP
jgi:kynurenine formamidase